MCGCVWVGVATYTHTWVQLHDAHSDTFPSLTMIPISSVDEQESGDKGGSGRSDIINDVNSDVSSDSGGGSPTAVGRIAEATAPGTGSIISPGVYVYQY